MTSLVNLFAATVLAGTPLLFGTLGEILSEKSGHLNLGVEGMMFMGGVGGLAGALWYEGVVANPSTAVALLVTVVCSFLCAAFGAFIYGVLTITLRANQNVTGLALTIFGTGFANFFGEVMGNRSPSGYAAAGDAVRRAFSGSLFPGLARLPLVGKALFSYNIMVYFSVALAVAMGWLLSRSRVGLNLRAVGENPATADAAGIGVSLYKYLAVCIGGGICGLGGMFIIMAPSGCGGIWVHNAIGGAGWIAVALVIFATWNPRRAVFGSLAFGCLSIMRLYVPLRVPMQIYDTFPYIATTVVLVAVSLKRLRENQPPASLGLAYFREER